MLFPVFEKLIKPDFDVRKTVLLEKESEEKIESREVKGNVEFASYTPNEIILKTESDNGGWLVLTDTYYPGWKAFVDGKETKIYRGDFTFRTIALPQASVRLNSTLSRPIGG